MAKGPVTLNDVLCFLDQDCGRSLAATAVHFKDNGWQVNSRAEIRLLIEDGASKYLIDTIKPDESATERVLKYQTTEAGRKMIGHAIEIDFEGVEPIPTLGQDIDELLKLSESPPTGNDSHPPDSDSDVTIVSKKTETKSGSAPKEDKKLTENSEIIKEIRFAYKDRFCPISINRGLKRLLDMNPMEADSHAAFIGRVVKDVRAIVGSETEQLDLELHARNEFAEGLSEQLDTANREVERLTRDLEAEKQKATNLQVQLNEANATMATGLCAVPAEELAKAGDKIAQLQKENEALRRVAELRKSDVEDVRRKNQELEETLSDLRSKGEAAVREIVGLQKQIREYQADLFVPPLPIQEDTDPVVPQSNDSVSWLLVSGMIIACAVVAWKVLL